MQNFHSQPYFNNKVSNQCKLKIYEVPKIKKKQKAFKSNKGTALIKLKVNVWKKYTDKTAIIVKYHFFIDAMFILRLIH